MERPRVAIIIPAYNEATTIGQVIRDASIYGQVFVVNDCSSDDTENVSRGAGAIVINHQKNGGYDTALSTGLKAAKHGGYDIAVTMDADGQHNPFLLESFLKEILIDKSLAFTVGIRDKKARLSEKVMSLYFLLRFGIQDPLCGLKAYRLEFLDETKDFDCIGTDLIFALAKKGEMFSQFAIKVRDRMDQPRFGSLFRANMKIFNAHLKIIVRDLRN